jgi:hypothetical protein
LGGILREESLSSDPSVTAVSKIYDLFKRAQLARARGVGEQADRRRAPRVHVQIPMFVYGYASGDVPFHEEAWTICINAHGGLIRMHAAVQQGQRLLLTNKGNERTQECGVVSVVLTTQSFTEEPFMLYTAVAFEFPASIPQFWHDLESGKTFAP